MHPLFYLTNMDLQEELINQTLKTSKASSNLCTQRASLKGVTFLTTYLVRALQDSPKTPDLLITSHLREEKSNCSMEAFFL